MVTRSSSRQCTDQLGIEFEASTELRFIWLKKFQLLKYLKFATSKKAPNLNIEFPKFENRFKKSISGENGVFVVS